MSIHNKINEVWRNVWSSHVRINGVWRDLDASVKIDGVWRDTYKSMLNPEEILGFHLVYTFLEDKTHPDHPSLHATHDLPVTFDLTGESIGNMDYTEKGVILEYTNDYPYKEGIVAYGAHLYAELLDGLYIDIADSESWSSSRTSNLDITIMGQTFHNCHGFYTAGWNNLFSTEENIIDTAELHGDGETSLVRLERYPILPLSSRDENYSPVSCIGIARDMHTAGKNMVGSYGVISHTISHIYLEGVAKPFVVEYYG